MKPSSRIRRPPGYLSPASGGGPRTQWNAVGGGALDPGVADLPLRYPLRVLCVASPVAATRRLRWWWTRFENVREMLTKMIAGPNPKLDIAMVANGSSLCGWAR